MLLFPWLVLFSCPWYGSTMDSPQSEIQYSKTPPPKRISCLSNACLQAPGCSYPQHTSLFGKRGRKTVTAYSHYSLWDKHMISHRRTIEWFDCWLFVELRAEVGERKVCQSWKRQLLVEKPVRRRKFTYVNFEEQNKCASPDVCLELGFWLC